MLALHRTLLLALRRMGPQRAERAQQAQHSSSSPWRSADTEEVTKSTVVLHS